MALDEIVYRFIAATAGVACVSVVNQTAIPCNNMYSHRILVAAMLAYEADTLQVALSEYDGVADVLLTESFHLHNPNTNNDKKPFLLWPHLKHLPAFQPAHSRVYHRTCSVKRRTKDMWEQERLDDACVTQSILNISAQYDVIVIGSVDEILSRQQLLNLKHCALPSLPASGAIGMPLGLLGRQFQTDWHHSNRPFSLSLPSIWPASSVNLRRSLYPLPGPAIAGGLHMTNYCFLPAMILKELWATEYNHQFSLDKALTNITDLKQQCYGMLSHRVSAGHSPETVVPHMLRMCPQTFPSWYGNVDPRELLLQRLLTNSKNHTSA